MICPKCKDEMNPLAMSDGVEVEFCHGCSGIMFDKGEVAEAFQLAEDIPGFQGAMRAQGGEEMPCPKCGGTFVEMQYAVGTDLLVDVCQGCGAIFLDRGEFPKLSRIAASVDKPQTRLLRAVKGLQSRGFEVLGVQKS